MAYLLVTADGQDCTGQQLTVKLSGLDLQLQKVAGQELTGNTRLVLMPILNKDKAVELEPLAAVISSNTGSFKSGDAVTSLMADWGVERALCKLNLVFTTVTIANAKYKMRVKIFSNGYWQPLTPLDILATGIEQEFAPVMASKVMIELVEKGDFEGVWKPVSTDNAVKEFTLAANTAPSDVELTLSGQTDSFKYSGLLPDTGFVIDDFAQVVNSFMQQNPDALTVPLHLSAKNAGKLTIDFKPATQVLLQQLPDLPDGKLNLYWHGSVASAKTSFTISQNAQLQELAFTPDYQSLAENLYFNPPTVANGKAQFGNQRSQIAQGFQSGADGINLSGFDIKLEKRSDSLIASLAIHPDQNGYPAVQPYGGVSLTIDDKSFWQNNWLSLTFPKPVHISDSRWWLVLSIQQGDAFWWFANNRPEPVVNTLYRIDNGSWLACADQLWLQTRVRVLATETKKLNNLVIAGESLPIHPGAAFKVDPSVLKKLNAAKQSSPLIIEFIAQSPGTLTLNQLRIAYT